METEPPLAAQPALGPRDALDRALVALLKADARAPTVALAKALGVSRGTVTNRIARLVESGVIRAFTVRLGEAYDRGLIRAHVMIKLAPRRTHDVEGALGRMPEVAALHSVSGVHDLIAVLQAQTVAEMDRLLDRVRGLDGVQNTDTSIILATRLER